MLCLPPPFKPPCRLAPKLLNEVLRTRFPLFEKTTPEFQRSLKVKAPPIADGAFLDESELRRSRNTMTRVDSRAGASSPQRRPADGGAALGREAPKKVCRRVDIGTVQGDIFRAMLGYAQSKVERTIFEYVGLGLSCVLGLGVDVPQIRLVSTWFGLVLNKYVDCSLAAEPFDVRVGIMLGIKGRARVWIRNTSKQDPHPNIKDPCMDEVEAWNIGSKMKERWKEWRRAEEVRKQSARETHDQVLTVLGQVDSFNMAAVKVVRVGCNESIWELPVRCIKKLAVLLKTVRGASYNVDGKLLEHAENICRALDAVEKQTKIAAAKQAERDRIAATEQAERDRIAAAEQAERDRIAAAEQAERDREQDDLAREKLKVLLHSVWSDQGGKPGRMELRVADRDSPTQERAEGAEGEEIGTRTPAITVYDQEEK